VGKCFEEKWIRHTQNTVAVDIAESKY
jgi:hypothetical protein